MLCAYTCVGIPRSSIDEDGDIGYSAGVLGPLARIGDEAEAENDGIRRVRPRVLGVGELRGSIASLAPGVTGDGWMP